jgi:hypothetical protein
VAAARRAPRYTLLSGLALVITVLFNLAYSNADIERYYLGPVLWIWTWIGILAAEVVDLSTILIGTLAPGPRASRLGSPAVRRLSIGVAALVAVLVLLPTVGDLDARRALGEPVHGHRRRGSGWRRRCR